MAFKLKGHELPGPNQRKSIKLNRSMDNSNLPDGRSKSSAFQAKREDGTESYMERKWSDMKSKVKKGIDKVKAVAKTARYMVSDEKGPYSMKTKYPGEKYRDIRAKQKGTQGLDYDIQNKKGPSPEKMKENMVKRAQEKKAKEKKRADEAARKKREKVQAKKYKQRARGY